MARTRNIKPSFFQNDALGELDPLARLLFIGMWTIADFKGCLEFRPKRIKAQLLPYDDCDIEQLAINLDKSRFISIYSVQGQLYVKITNFERHQNPHKNEKDAGSECPDESEKDCEINEMSQDGINREQDGTTPALSLIPYPFSLNPSPSSAGAAKVRQKPRNSEEDPGFADAWNSYPKRPGASRADAFKAWSARIKDGAKPDAMLAGVRRYAEHVERAGTEPQYIKQPATFFGPGKHYEADWAPQASRGGLGDKFQVAHLDHSSSREAMDASVKRHGIVIPDGEIEF